MLQWLERCKIGTGVNWYERDTNQNQKYLFIDACDGRSVQSEGSWYPPASYFMNVFPSAPPEVTNHTEGSIARSRVT